MKKIVLIFLLLPCVVNAQEWRIALSGGVSIITKPKQAPPEYNDSKLTPGGVGMLSISRPITDRIDAGLDIAAVNLVRTADIELYSQHGQVGTLPDARMHVGKLGFMITPSLSYHVHHFFFGPQVGYFVTSKSTAVGPALLSNASTSSADGHYHVYYNDVRGLMAGAHVG